MARRSAPVGGGPPVPVAPERPAAPAAVDDVSSVPPLGPRVPPPAAAPAQPDEGHRQRPRAPFDAERVGDPSIAAAELRRMGNVLATQHLFILLARGGDDRGATIDRIADLLVGLDDGPYARRLLLQVGEAGRVVDIYPLEVMARIMERAPGLLPRTEFGPVITNAAEVRGRTWPVGETIPLSVPLNLRLTAFAIDGGASPGYTLAPGPPAAYDLELGASGVYRLLFRGEVRRISRVDRLTVRVENPPPLAPE